MPSRNDIRQFIRQKRRTLSTEQQRIASSLLAEQLFAQPEVQQAKHIAIYLANDGEINLSRFQQACRQHNKHVYLPVLHPFCQGHLLFLHYDKHTPMHKNQYGILEPKLAVQSVMPVQQLDLILTPLVAFDALGNRLGMGGGYYDRTLAFKDSNPNTGPHVFGVAHQIQKIDVVPTESWDIPLARIITDNGCYY